MATLEMSWLMVNDPAHAKFRRQVEMAMWQIARQKQLGGTETGASAALATRILRGDEWPIGVAIKAGATDVVAQEAYVAGGNSLPDAAVVQWLTGAWNTIAGIGG